ncbi:unnamed protein product [Microthlaspi erraticum]|uniref:F-box protein n=1 Tax=Microthlaspi erraticum TaxID=1685480 RepID=A0A6D2J4F0_9BRAS|nr:unnamed protein product [Microthlaspi erraticum]
MSLSASVVVTRVLSFPVAVKQNRLKRKREYEITQNKAVLVTMHKDDDKHEHTEQLPPSWEALDLVGSYMEPETLAIASCVSTAWLKCFSSENLWRSLLISRSSQASSPYKFALEATETVSYKQVVTAVEKDAKRRRKDQLPELKLSLSDLSFIVHVSAGTKKASVLKRGKELVFGCNDKFHIEADVSSSGITVGEKDVRMTWQVVYKNWEKFFTMADTTRSLDDDAAHTRYGWFTEKLECKDNRKLVGDVKPRFNGDFLDKIGFSMVDSDGWSSLLVDGFLRYLQRFLLE